MQQEIARKLVALNPSLKGDGNTEDFILSTKGQLEKKPVTKVAPSANPLTKASNVDHLLELAQNRYANEKRELESQLSLIQAKLNGLKKRHLNDTMDEMIRLDPNLSSIVTQEAMKRRRPFLDLLGFTTGLFVDRAKETRK